ncbi:Programmed cell death protein 7 ES18 [Channa argus]|uniref:Programmed cell death protein 7 ES18 n=2 Tax=Channa argus TaxID=215402 RepID=A0A6G1P9R3_CHAAH|nr:Programmed cell death protein 7 ES18 [Channa argus]
MNMGPWYRLQYHFEPLFSLIQCTILAHMDNTHHHQAPSDKQRPLGYEDSPYSANRPPPSSLVPAPTDWTSSQGPTQPDHAGPRWPPSPGYYSYQTYGYNYASPHPGGGGFGGPRFAPPFGFDPAVPPPPFRCPPPGHMVPPASVNTYSNTGTFPPQFRAGFQAPQRDFQSVSDSNQSRHQEYENFGERGALLGSPLPPYPGQDYNRGLGTATTQPEDEDALQRRQDTQWLKRFLQSKVKKSESPQTKQDGGQQSGVRNLREALYGAARLVSALEESCESLKHNMENDCVWSDSYLTALSIKRELQHKVKLLGDEERLNKLKAKVTRLSKRRARKLRARKRLQIEEKQRQEHISDKEAAIDKWMMKMIHEVEEKKREQELKLAADSVLCEVRRKQADVKRMQDVLRSLEKLRKLRKEAASRKGIVTEQECDKAFSSQLEQLRGVIKRRTAVYSAEEKALMVMLEGEQEEERRREHEKQVKKERERQLQRKRKVESMLFGDELPVDSILEPFREYYTQAERSLHVLLQIRREWDVFVVAADHPDGTPLPQSWVLPAPPSDQDWALALHSTDTDEDGV